MPLNRELLPRLGFLDAALRQSANLPPSPAGDAFAEFYGLGVFARRNPSPPSRFRNREISEHLIEADEGVNVGGFFLILVQNVAPKIDTEFTSLRFRRSLNRRLLKIAEHTLSDHHVLVGTQVFSVGRPWTSSSLSVGPPSIVGRESTLNGTPHASHRCVRKARRCQRRATQSFEAQVSPASETGPLLLLPTT